MKNELVIIWHKLESYALICLILDFLTQTVIYYSHRGLRVKLLGKKSIPV